MQLFADKPPPSHQETLVKHRRFGEIAVRFFVLSLPFIAITGNTLADLWVVIIGFGFLISSATSHRWEWLKQGWLVIAMVFWVWAIICSLISQWPIASLNDSVTWFRFPIFAVALAEIFKRWPTLIRQFALSLAAATLIVAIYILVERLTHSSADRIFGPFYMERPGWYLFGFGLPAVLLARYTFLTNETSLPTSLLLTVLIVTAAFASYQIYVTFALLLGLTLYSAFTTSKIHLELAVVAVLVSAVAFMLLASDVLNERFTTEVLRSLPWQNSSRYYNFWAGGLTTALDNLAFGVGPNNYDFNCYNLVEMEGTARMGFYPGNPVDGCSTHPHQRYIQIAAETGLIGLLLFCSMAIALITRSIKYCFRRDAKRVVSAIALSLLIVNFWPISTFSEAFGQKLNFFYWFHIGFALAMLNISSGNTSKRS